MFYKKSNKLLLSLISPLLIITILSLLPVHNAIFALTGDNDLSFNQQLLIPKDLDI
jgi:hypothetical protein